MTIAVLATVSLADEINAQHRAVEAAVSSSLDHAIRAGELLIEAKSELPHGSWLAWLDENFEGSERTAQVYMVLAKRRDEIDGEIRNAVADLGLRAAVASLPKASRAAKQTSNDDEGAAAYYSVEAWNRLPEEERRRILDQAGVGSRTKFNRTNDNVEWAFWTWNPVTGCDHGCDYCYARVLAQRYYVDLPEEERFRPVFRPTRLWAPRLSEVPSAYDPDDPATIGEKNVFVCSMADLFGKWVPQDWIDAVFTETIAAPDWNFLFLTKFPQRLAEQAWPENAWCGASVDRQARVATAERSFRGVKAGVKWLSCEPMLERLTFSDLSMFDWVVIGGQSANSQVEEFQPPWEWIRHLSEQAWAAGCKVYWKPNLKNRPREYPSGIGAERA